MVQNGSSNVRNGKANKFSDILHPILCKSDEMKTSKFCYSAFFFHLESAYKMETFELSCTRLPHDRTAGRVKYFLQKDNRVMFIIAKNREDNKFSCSHHVSPKPCSNDSFSMNETCFFQTKKHYPSRCRSIHLFKIFTRALQFNI